MSTIKVQEKYVVTRVLWLTDTFDDHNGVSMVLQAMHREIKIRNLPIDIMVCSKRLKSGSNTIVDLKGNSLYLLW